MIDTLLSKNLLPDWLVRPGIRRLLAQRLRDEAALAQGDRGAYLDRYAADLRRRPIAENTREANTQHYEVPAEFFQLCLGRRMKYSGCLYPTGRETLDEAEEAMLAVYVERAQLADGQSILDLGCGWGALSLYLAGRFPHAQITGVSNSASQRDHIEKAAREKGLRNLRIICGDINTLDLPPGAFDRVVSVEMFEHLKNYERILANISRWLKPAGKLFVHIFTHDRFSYHFVPQGPSDWMARHFFTGGQMPAHDLLACFQGHLALVADWKVDGTHYQRTAEAWLRNLDAHHARIHSLFALIYGSGQATRWCSYWRVFFMSCAELWGYRDGREWGVSHYLFEQRGDRA